MDMYSKIIKKNKVFNNLFCEQLLIKLSTKFKEKRYGPGDVISQTN